jgi:hypothetical protein
MHATLNGNPTRLEEITLDEFGWEKTGNQGAATLILYLTQTDLLSIGDKVFQYAIECRAEEPGFFQEEGMKDVPVPKSEHVFVEDPSLLAVYLDESFWSRTTLLAILNSMGVVRSPEPHCWIENFGRYIADGDLPGFVFGAAILD